MYAKTSILVLAICFFPLSAGKSAAMFARPVAAPLERIAANIQSYIDQHPNEGKAYYHLARANYLSFINRSHLVPQSGEHNGLPSLAPDHLLGNHIDNARFAEAKRRALKEAGVASEDALPDAAQQGFYDGLYKIQSALTTEGWEPPKLSPEDAFARATAALTAFDKAIELEPNQGLYHLGRGSLIQQICEFRELHRESALSESLVRFEKEHACEAYRAAFDVSIDEDLDRENMPLGGLSDVVSHEAGSAWLKLCSNAPVQERAEVKEAVAKLKKLRMGPITPIVFSLQSVDSIRDLVGTAVVSYDFDGDGCAEDWQWIKPTAGFLVWMDGSQEAVSGVRLFGSHTFNMLWENGFEPLQALDDDANGWLGGTELKGLAVWFDRNSDGRSQTGEIVSLASLGVRRLATHADTTDAGMLTNSAGLDLESGESLPLWDWLARPVSAFDRSTVR